MSTPNKPPAILQEATPTPSTRNSQSSSGQTPEQHSFEQQSLFSPQSAHTSPVTSAVAVDQLWLCIQLPALPLEVLQQDVEAAAVFEDVQGIRKVLLSSAKARAAGIGPGMSVNAALALIPTLMLHERNPQREEEILHELAAWAERFTSFVCIAGSSTLLLELAGSLKLFSGLKRLRQRIAFGLQEQGFTSRIAIAPTALAASWFARAGVKVCIQNASNLPGKLASLPVTCLDWPTSITDSLRRMGVSQVGECLRLPRQGFAKRFGACRLLELDRALGRVPDPRVSYRAPERFSADYEFTEEQSDRSLLLNGCEVLLKKLEHFLVTRQVAVQELRFAFFYLQHPATYLTLGCVRADRAVQHWLQLLSLKLERLELGAPVIAIRLCGGKSETFSAQTEALPFSNDTRKKYSAPITHLAERLTARIGEASVHGVTTVAEHRPRYAWQRHEAGMEAKQCTEASDQELQQRRPLWMLQKPCALSTAKNLPVCEGVLQLVNGPERLETGWWDEEGIARDYFVARNPRGVYLWIYKDRAQRGEWYLEGVFG